MSRPWNPLPRWASRPAGRASALRALAAPLTSRTSLRPLLGVLSAFWIYVALSNVMYANNMQASLSSQNIEHVFAPWDARLVQHLLLYPLFILCMWVSLRTGWQRAVARAADPAAVRPRLRGARLPGAGDRGDR